MGLVPPKSGYLKAAREACDRHGVLLIFDEVISGFRVGRGGAQALYDVRPDMTCLGKIIGGGLPLGAYGGRADIMAKVAPEGPVYQAGTLSGNPLAMAAGLAVLQKLDAAAYKKLEALGAYLEKGLATALETSGADAHVRRLGSAFTVFFRREPVVDFATADKTDREAFAKFFNGMLDRGVYLPPAQMEAGFVSLAHTEADLDAAIAAARGALGVN